VDYDEYGVADKDILLPIISLMSTFWLEIHLHHTTEAPGMDGVVSLAALDFSLTLVELYRGLPDEFVDIFMKTV